MASNPTQADFQAAARFITDEDLQELEALKRELLNRVDKAHGDGRVYLMGQYTRLVALVSPEIKRVRDRFDRETLAAARKEHKTLRKAGKEASA